MNSAAPYYQPATSNGYQEIPLTNYTTPADEFSRLAAQLAAQVNPAQSNPDDEHAHLADLLLAANSADDPQAHIQPYTPAPPERGKRKRVSESPSILGEGSSKRVKQDPPHASISAARAAGVHSAAALFRSPAPGSEKKYTRPPMSKLYASLKLTPEEFLQLQAAAKTYMLDPEHPERQESVGIRAKGDNDMSKLKLFNCVRDFLADGVGERFFSENASSLRNDATDGPGFGDEPAPAQQRWVWPRDGNQIVSLVTPLMRRMVTNERQRMYANETRKGGKGGQSATGPDGELLDPSFHEARPESPTPSGVMSGSKSRGRTATQTGIDGDSRQPPLPRCSSNVIQFIFTHQEHKLLRFDWPDPDDSPRHAHMTFDRLVKTVSEHASGVKAAMNEASMPGSDHTPSYIPSPLANLARLKASEALNRSRELRPSDEDAHAEQIPGVVDATVPAVDLGEQLRRELQSQVDGVLSESNPDRSREKSYPAGLSFLKDMGAKLRALAPSGFTEITSESHWDTVKEEVAKCLWLEGCLRVAIEMS